jgi:hypothetical protein
MPPSGRRSHWLSYLATLSICLVIIAASVATIGWASVGMMQRAERNKSPLDVQIESAREIRAALKKPIVTPPLAPITARPLREPRAVAAEQADHRLAVQARAAQAMNAMAMDQSGMAREPAASYTIQDRHAPQ